MSDAGGGATNALTFRPMLTVHYVLEHVSGDVQGLGEFKGPTPDSVGFLAAAGTG